MIAALQGYSFPGNVRELKNIVERALIASGGAEIRPLHLQFQTELGVENGVGLGAGPTSPEVEQIPLNLREAELWLIKRAIAKTEGNVSEAARLLGTNRSRIYRLLAAQEGA